MNLKANLHFHTADDPQDWIPYTFFEGLDRAAVLGFKILALTCHRKAAATPEYVRYAAKRDILLIPGIELEIRGRHVVVLNVTAEAENIRTFDELRRYKKDHPEIFILAPHPFFYGNYSLKKHLEKNVDLFDAVEKSWFYSENFDRNIGGKMIAKKHRLPYLATSDTHILRFLDASYATVTAPEKTIPAVFAAIKNGAFLNTSSPRKLWREMVWEITKWKAREIFKKSRR
jgi:predicted metal-dependent phosphoesterase TrpH